MGAWQELTKRLGATEYEVSALKAEFVTVAHAVNATKPEINGIVGEFVAANFGFKIFNMEKTIWDFQEKRDEAARRDPLSLKEDLDTLGRRFNKVAGRADEALGGILAEHDKRINDAKKYTDQKTEEVGRIARSADQKANRMSAGAGREGHAPATSVASMRDLRDAGQAINSLETRVNRLIAALS